MSMVNNEHGLVDVVCRCVVSVVVMLVSGSRLMHDLSLASE